MALKTKQLVIGGIAAGVLALIASTMVTYAEKRQEALIKAFIYETIAASAKIRAYHASNGKLPVTLKEVGIEPVLERRLDMDDQSSNATKLRHELALRDGALFASYTGPEPLNGTTLVLRYTTDGSGSIAVDCTESTLPQKFRLGECRAPGGR
ncbi:MAG: hypothetical protein ACKOEC_17015 [Acidimicrobiia bacterium]